MDTSAAQNFISAYGPSCRLCLHGDFCTFEGRNWFADTLETFI